ncbi:hypothetical protein H2198_003269 [Neophaeococcomyces mojaviensis]|uniref:Uncharacterized protein n=1 Tax=Neophaeococcomyces mojaviensis TaxID=3383035 RepID=A0ACC3ABQ4_9EURO|nr:hypothetical protein H2198_003269 [Knufia sp. JES_112]
MDSGTVDRQCSYGRSSWTFACPSSDAGWRLGLMGMDIVAERLEPWLDEAAKSLEEQPIQLLRRGNTGTTRAADLGYLPLGVGFLVSFTKLDHVMQVLRSRTERKALPPAVMWFFAAEEPSVDTYTTWARNIRHHYAETKQYIPQIWIQVGGSAVAALELAQSDAKPDALVVQGSDAGGHGMERGASIVGLIPETKSLFDRAYSGDRRPHLLASGGIVNAEGAAAALCLGAEGVIMGTRFLASPETIVPHPEYRERVLAAKDGAQSTIRAKVFDELKGPNIWPAAYDGRALVSKNWRDMHEGGVPIETIRESVAKAAKDADGGYGIGSDRAVVWCGTGVGLVNEMKKAGDVVVEVREGVSTLLGTLRTNVDSVHAS